MVKCFIKSINEASFDFISNLIVLESREEKHKEAIEKLLNTNIYDDIQLKLDMFEINILSTLYHEITHFLDLTTTTWGLEFIIRKTLFINKKNLQSQKVFELNAAEIELHYKYTRTYENSPSIGLLNCITTHGILYDEKYGALILLIFFTKDKKVLETPISMLSVLETNAYCSEILTKIRCIKINPDYNEQRIQLKLLNTEVNLYLNSSEDSEYKALFILAKNHFPFLNLEELCTFLKMLINNILNFEMELSMVSGIIHSSFINKSIGKAITHDLNRGMSRHIVIFKFILFIFSFINENEDSEDLKTELKNKPQAVIDKFYKEFLRLTPLYGINFDNSKKILEKQIKIFDTSAILESIDVNKNLVISNLDCINNISNFKLFDIYLGDATIIQVPNRLNTNIDLYSSNSDILYINKIIKADKIKKFHVHPYDVPDVYNLY